MTATKKLNALLVMLAAAYIQDDTETKLLVMAELVNILDGNEIIPLVLKEITPDLPKDLQEVLNERMTNIYNNLSKHPKA